MNDKLNFIDALRGYAILGVLLTHSTQSLTDLPNIFYNFGVQGSRGVQLFFIVSSFTLFYSLSKINYERIRDTKDFFIRRFFRIAPTYYTAALFYYLFYTLLEPQSIYSQSGYSLEVIITTFTFTTLLSPNWLLSVVPGGWSISAEMLFYLFVPLFFVVVKNLKQSLMLVVVSILISYISAYYIINFTSFENLGDIRSGYMFYSFPNQLPIFCLGICLYFLLKNKISISDKTSKHSNLAVIISLVLLLLLSINGGIGGPYFPSHLIYGLLFVLLAYGLGTNSNNILINKFSIFIGQISFSMYIIHFFVVDLVSKYITVNLQEFMHSEIILIIVFLITLTVSVPLAYLSYKYIELPGIRLGKRISSIV